MITPKDQHISTTSKEISKDSPKNNPKDSLKDRSNDRLEDRTKGNLRKKQHIKAIDLNVGMTWAIREIIFPKLHIGLEHFQQSYNKAP